MTSGTSRIKYHNLEHLFLLLPLDLTFIAFLQQMKAGRTCMSHELFYVGSFSSVDTAVTSCPSVNTVSLSKLAIALEAHAELEQFRPTTVTFKG